MKDNKSFSIETQAGTFFAVEDDACALHKGIYLMFQPDGYDDVIDVAAIIDTPNNGGERDAKILVFGDVSKEEPTHEIVISRKEIEEAL